MASSLLESLASRFASRSATAWRASAAGSPFSQQARFRRENMVPSGVSSEYVLAGDEGPGARFHFCPRCGATVYYEPLSLPGYVSIPVGAFAEPSFPAPTVSVYEGRMHTWVIPPSLRSTFRELSAGRGGV